MYLDPDGVWVGESLWLPPTLIPCRSGVSLICIWVEKLKLLISDATDATDAREGDTAWRAAGE